MKRLLLKLIIFFVAAGCLLVVLPSGPFWHLWHGKSPGGNSDIDLEALLSILGLSLAFSLICLRILSSIFLDPSRKKTDLKNSEDAPTEHFIDTKPK